MSATKETTLTGWAVGLQELPPNEHGVTHMLVFVNGQASVSGGLVPSAAPLEKINVLLDADGVRGLRDQLQAAAAAVSGLVTAAAVPAQFGANRAQRRAAKRAG